MTTAEAEDLRRIAAHFRVLLETSPRTPDAVEAWTENAYAMYDRLQRDFPAVRLPIQVVHFLHDADVRARDQEYRQRQEEAMREIIRALEQGAVPRSRGLTLSFTSIELVLFALALTVAVVLLVRSCA